MKIPKIPEKIFGREIKGAIDIALKEDGTNPLPPNTSQVLTPSSISNPEQYIKIPNTNILIAKEETCKGLSWNNAHYKLAEKGLFMPTPRLFINYFSKVKQSAEGSIVLYDGNSNPIQYDEITDIYKYLTTNHRTGCWTWLDALFKEGSGFKNLDIETDHRVVVKNGAKTLEGKVSKLESCLWIDGYADMTFNTQGLATTKSKKQEYKQGKNIYFFFPRKNAVARFNAYSVGACLGCNRDPGSSIPRLGVFACAEGAVKK